MKIIVTRDALKRAEAAEQPRITLTKAEVQSHFDRQQWAEGLILQLPAEHDGRNSWLLNYGVKEEARERRARRGIKFDEATRAAETIDPDDTPFAGPDGLDGLDADPKEEETK